MSDFMGQGPISSALHLFGVTANDVLGGLTDVSSHEISTIDLRSGTVSHANLHSHLCGLAQFKSDRLTHTGLPNAEQCAGHAEGWAHCLGRLAAVAAGRDRAPLARPYRRGVTARRQTPVARVERGWRDQGKGARLAS